MDLLDLAVDAVLALRDRERRRGVLRAVAWALAYTALLVAGLAMVFLGPVGDRALPWAVAAAFVAPGAAMLAVALGQMTLRRRRQRDRGTQAGDG